MPCVVSPAGAVVVCGTGVVVCACAAPAIMMAAAAARMLLDVLNRWNVPRRPDDIGCPLKSAKEITMMLTRFQVEGYTPMNAGQASDSDFAALFNSRESRCTHIGFNCLDRRHESARASSLCACDAPAMLLHRGVGTHRDARH